MSLPSTIPPFGITHPLGLPRPVDPENVFGAKTLFFARNLMPVPTGCLHYFDAAVYRPYMESLVNFLGGSKMGWSGPIIIDGPQRYCLLQDGEPAFIPAEIRPLLPEPPRVRLREVLDHFDSIHEATPPLQLLDVLTMIAEDLGPERFAAAAAGHPWIVAYMR